LGDVFLEFRASSLVEGFENTAPAWLAKQSPAAAFIRAHPRNPWLNPNWSVFCG
jgi:hypothetical protein